MMTLKMKQSVKWFVIMEILIYVVFNAIDIGSNDAEWIRVSTLLKILSIALCLVLLGRLSYIQPKNQDNRLMVLIMTMTLASDVFLLFTRHFNNGLVLFIGVQLLYAIRIQKRLNVKSLILKAIFFTVIFFFFRQSMAEPLNFVLMLSLGTFYAFLFAINIVTLALEILMTSRKTTDFSVLETVYDRRLFIVGLVLYALCDINVAIYNFPNFFNSNALLLRIYEMSALAMWLFYLPGQVALTLSVRRKVDGTNR